MILRDLYENKAMISIHTPARGVTLYTGTSLATAAYFNPHSRKGSDALDMLLALL